ncbi:MAG: hypothetical protein JXA25_02550 [Anaerolineales bacterium]|nr:hypothetical protein [Anaerolineales bacterium]
MVGAILKFSLVLFAREISELGSVLLLAGTALGCLFLLILLSIGCCRLFYLIHSGILKFLLLYTANLVMVFVFLFLFVRILGGASMAVIDGAVSSSELRGLSIQAAHPLLALAQLVIVPWVLVAVVVLNRIAFRGKQDEQPVS